MTEQEFISIYPNTKNSDICTIAGMTLISVSRWARHLGLKKSPEHIKRIQADRAAGRLLGQESRRKIGDARRGKKLSPEVIRKREETKLKSGTRISGERHPNWKGGRPWPRFRDPGYRLWRDEVLRLGEYRCVECGLQGEKGKRGLVAHHLKSYLDHPGLRLDVSNGEVLCRPCHLKHHGKNIVLEPIPCGCGCGATIMSHDIHGRPRKYVNHHAPKAAPVRDARLNAPLIACACGCGTMIRSIGARNRPIKYAWKHGPGRPKKKS